MLAHVWDSVVDTSIKKYQGISPTQVQGMWRRELPAGYSSELSRDMSHLYQLVLQQRRASPPHGKWITFCLFCFYWAILFSNLSAGYHGGLQMAVNSLLPPFEKWSPFSGKLG